MGLSAGCGAPPAAARAHEALQRLPVLGGQLLNRHRLAILALAAKRGLTSPARGPPRPIRAPSRGNHRLVELFDAANTDGRLRAWWYMQQVNADRRDMSDHFGGARADRLQHRAEAVQAAARAGVEPAISRRTA